MKKNKLALVALAISTLTLFSFNTIQTNDNPETTAIKGTVTPADKATKVWAISATDTLNASVKDGTFEIQNVKPGTYSLIFEAEKPFSDTRKKDLVIPDHVLVADIGEIKLQKM